MRRTVIPCDGTGHISTYLRRSHSSAEVASRDSLAVTESQQNSQMTTETEGCAGRNASLSAGRIMPAAANKRQMTLTATAFLRRFFLHLLPKGFVRIRHFGFLANRLRASHLLLSRRLPAPCSATELRVRTPRPALRGCLSLALPTL